MQAAKRGGLCSGMILVGETLDFPAMDTAASAEILAHLPQDFVRDILKMITDASRHSSTQHLAVDCHGHSSTQHLAVDCHGHSSTQHLAVDCRNCAAMPHRTTASRFHMASASFFLDFLSRWKSLLYATPFEALELMPNVALQPNLACRVWAHNSQTGLVAFRLRIISRLLLLDSKHQWLFQVLAATCETMRLEDAASTLEDLEDTDMAARVLTCFGASRMAIIVSHLFSLAGKKAALAVQLVARMPADKATLLMRHLDLHVAVAVLERMPAVPLQDLLLASSSNQAARMLAEMSSARRAGAFRLMLPGQAAAALQQLDPFLGSLILEDAVEEWEADHLTDVISRVHPVVVKAWVEALDSQLRKQFVEALNPVVATACLKAWSAELASQLLREVHPEHTATILVLLSEAGWQKVLDIFQRIDPTRVAQVLEFMSGRGDASQLIKRMPSAQAAAVVGLMPPSSAATLLTRLEARDIAPMLMALGDAASAAVLVTLPPGLAARVLDSVETAFAGQVLMAMSLESACTMLLAAGVDSGSRIAREIPARHLGAILGDSIPEMTIAQYLQKLPAPVAAVAMQCFPAQTAARVLVEIGSEIALPVLVLIPAAHLGAVVTFLPHEQSIALTRMLPPEVTAQMMERVTSSQVTAGILDAVSLGHASCLVRGLAPATAAAALQHLSAESLAAVLQEIETEIAALIMVELKPLMAAAAWSCVPSSSAAALLECMPLRAACAMLQFARSATTAAALDIMASRSLPQAASRVQGLDPARAADVMRMMAPTLAAALLSGFSLPKAMGGDVGAVQWEVLCRMGPSGMMPVLDALGSKASAALKHSPIGQFTQIMKNIHPDAGSQCLNLADDNRARTALSRLPYGPAGAILERMLPHKSAAVIGKLPKKHAANLLTVMVAEERFVLNVAEQMDVRATSVLLCHVDEVSYKGRSAAILQEMRLAPMVTVLNHGAPTWVAELLQQMDDGAPSVIQSVFSQARKNVQKRRSAVVPLSRSGSFWQQLKKDHSDDLIRDILCRMDPALVSQALLEVGPPQRLAWLERLQDSVRRARVIEAMPTPVAAATLANLMLDLGGGVLDAAPVESAVRLLDAMPAESICPLLMHMSVLGCARLMLALPERRTAAVIDEMPAEYIAKVVESMRTEDARILMKTVNRPLELLALIPAASANAVFSGMNAMRIEKSLKNYSVEMLMQLVQKLEPQQAAQLMSFFPAGMSNAVFERAGVPAPVKEAYTALRKQTLERRAIKAFKLLRWHDVTKRICSMLLATKQLDMISPYLGLALEALNLKNLISVYLWVSILLLTRKSHVMYKSIKITKTCGAEKRKLVYEDAARLRMAVENVLDETSDAELTLDVLSFVQSLENVQLQEWQVEYLKLGDRMIATSLEMEVVKFTKAETLVYTYFSNLLTLWSQKVNRFREAHLSFDLALQHPELVELTALLAKEWTDRPSCLARLRS
ncbi:hypothetical protein CYMTET_34732 [Cymbomonas tetramitiformis]|uniref:Magnesium transporter MgtE intracellular domain-containing protein n=1 Tax=Cymbomonas tetramitiformis TaxID=36881 RepID=A0AAE0FAF5_9CHLO|nr:hypothetical protein CYMTET_34732 [Cymbomonas tetramitiformis]